MTNTNTPPDRLMRMPQVLEVVPIAESTVWKYVKQGTFPRPVRLGRCSVWKESEVQAWLSKLTA